jgi:hypothetical protein
MPQMRQIAMKRAHPRRLTTPPAADGAVHPGSTALAPRKSSDAPTVGLARYLTAAASHVENVS